MSMAYPEAARIVREAMKDKSYRVYPMGQRAGEYLRWKRGRLTDESYQTYERCLDRLAREFPDLEARDFEPPVGTERLEEFLDHHWGSSAGSTYNKNLGVLSDFFKFLVLKGRLHGDPTLPIQTHKKRDVHREVFRDDDFRRILSSGPSDEYLRRDRIALRLLLQYGLRRGTLRAVQFKHFDASRRRLTIFLKGGKVREMPIPDPSFWDDLDKLQFERDAEPSHFLMCRVRQFWRGYAADGGHKFEKVLYPALAMSPNGLHNWWYGCLERAGVVPKGMRRGEKMHKARHTAGQNMLDSTGNLKAVQKLLGHSSISTTADVYTDWDIEALETSLRQTIDPKGLIP